MKINLLYGTEAVVLPIIPPEKLEKATKRDIKLLFALAADPALRNDTSLLADKFSLTEEEVNAVLAFWCDAGIIAVPTDEVGVTNKQESKPTAQHQKRSAPSAAEIPDYTSSELSNILEKRSDARIMLEECERILGKVFSISQVKTLVGLYDNLGFSSEYVIKLCEYCKSIGKTALPYIYNTGFGLYNDGITDVEALDERIAALKAAASFEGEIRSLFGMKSRALTTKEKKFITAWAEYGYGIDIVRKAYEITVDTIKEPTPNYVHAILTRWHDEGLSDLDAIEAERNSKQPATGSFNTNDFFELAMKRSFMEDGSPAEQPDKK